MEDHNEKTTICSARFAVILSTGPAACALGTNVWKKDYYKDVFGDLTEDYYIGTDKPMNGTYNTSSVTDGKLDAELHIDAHKVSIVLYENGTEKVKNGTTQNIIFPVAVKKTDGSTFVVNGNMRSGGDCIEILEDQAEIFFTNSNPALLKSSISRALLEGPGEISMYITRKDQPASTYLFKINCNNYAEIYAEEIALPIQETAYEKAETLFSRKDYEAAISIFEALRQYKDSESRVRACLAAIEENIPQKGSNWRDITAVAAGTMHTVGLRKDGTVVAVGNNDHGECNVESWKDIIAIAAGNYHTVGLRSNGTVVAVGMNSKNQCNVSGWKDIVAVAAGYWYTIGLKKDGTVVAVGANDKGQCDVSGWKSIKSIAAGGWTTIGTRSNGTVITAGTEKDVKTWENIVSVAEGEYHAVGLQRDGKVLAVGINSEGICDVSDWRDIVAIAAGDQHTVGLRSDGTVVATGNNSNGQCDVSDWKDIVAVAAGGKHTVGLKSDGAVIAVGSNGSGQCDLRFQ